MTLCYADSEGAVGARLGTGEDRKDGKNYSLDATRAA